MGLDVYLYHASNLEKYRENEQKISGIEEKFWEVAKAEIEKQFHDTPYFQIDRKLREEGEARYSTRYHELRKQYSEEDLRESEKIDDLIYKEFERMCKEDPDLSILKQQNVEECSMTCVEIPSELYPDHYYKIGYFRSSYNSAGINSVARKFGIPGLYEIFSSATRDYYLQPDWEDALSKVEDALEKWRKQAQRVGNYRVIMVDPGSIKSAEEYDKAFKAPTNEGQALEVFLKNLESDSSSMGSYSSREGEFFLNPSRKITLKALIKGRCDSWRGNTLGVYAICEVEDEGGKKESELEWYIQSLEIVKETIQYVLNQDDPSKYILAWSS